MDLAALRYALKVQEAIDAAEAVQATMHDERCLMATQLLTEAQQAATQLLQAATNACSAEEVAAATELASNAAWAASCHTSSRLRDHIRTMRTPHPPTAAVPAMNRSYHYKFRYA